MYIKDSFDDNGGCIKINKPIETLFDKKKPIIFFAIKAKQRYLSSIVFFFDRKNISSSAKALNGSNLVRLRLRYLRNSFGNHPIRFKEKS